MTIPRIRTSPEFSDDISRWEKFREKLSVEVTLHPIIHEIARLADAHADADDPLRLTFTRVAEDHMEETFRDGKLMHDPIRTLPVDLWASHGRVLVI